MNPPLNGFVSFPFCFWEAKWGQTTLDQLSRLSGFYTQLNRIDTDKNKKSVSIRG